MKYYKGRISEALLEPYKNAAARLSLPREAHPQPGQYLQASSLDHPNEALPATLFAVGTGSSTKTDKQISILIAGPLPEGWRAGTRLALRGPLGRGFHLPQRLKRLALAALGAHPGRLLPLVRPALEGGATVLLLTDHAGADLPLAVEVQPLDALKEARRWADLLAVDIDLEDVENLANLLGLGDGRPKSPEVQVLVHSPLPCGGLAQCGVCALSTPKGQRLVCEDGPVFDLAALI